MSLSIDQLKKQEEIVFLKSTSLPEGVTKPVKGFDFNHGPATCISLADALGTTGFQATELSQAIREVNRMIEAKNDILAEENGQELAYLDYGSYQRPKTGCTIFLGYTSNMISCGMREVIKFLVQHNMVDCLVTTAGGVEEDFIKCMAPSYLGDFNMQGAFLRKNGINRIGNLLIPNDNYCLFEDWLLPILDDMLKEQNEKNFRWTPSKMIRELGRRIDDESSVYYWAYKNNIPVFCPAITDGSLGDILYFHSYRNPGLILDIIEDVRSLNNTAVRSHKTGLIILGGGLVKHHICNANMMRNGAEYAVFINTANEYDGSDSGARPDEAVSWGKIKPTAKPVKVHCDASIAFFLIVSDTFAKFHHHRSKTAMKNQTNQGAINSTMS